MRFALFLVAVMLAAGGGYMAWQYSSDQAASPAFSPPPPPAPPPGHPPPPPPPPPGAPPPMIPPPETTPPLDDMQDKVSRRRSRTQQTEPSPDTSSLADSLGSGIRAVSVSTESLTGLIGHIAPGDKVDVLVTHNPHQVAQSMMYRPTTTEVVVPNAAILAINGTSQPPSVTLRVNPYQAQQIRLAEQVGTVSVALRATRDRGERIPLSTTTEYLSQERWLPSNTVKVIRGVDANGQSAINPVHVTRPIPNYVTEPKESGNEE